MMLSPGNPSTRFHAGVWRVCAVLMMVVVARALPLAEFLAESERAGERVADFSVEGTVRAVDPARGRLVLEDATAVALVEIPDIPPGLKPGAGITITGERCHVARGRHALRLGTAPVVDYDGHHSAYSRTGEVHLEKGKAPFRLEWFNGAAEASVSVEIRPPGGEFAVVPAAAYSHANGAGLRYDAYVGDGWDLLPEFSGLRPEASGVVPDLDISVRPREQDAGVVFHGFIDVAASGLHTLRLTSDDGAKLFIGSPRVSVQMREPSVAMEPPIPWNAGSRRPPGEWVTAEGNVTYAALHRGALKLELAGPDAVCPVVVPDFPGNEIPALQRRVKVTGVGRADGIVVPSAALLELLEQRGSEADTLLEIGQVRQLPREQAAKPWRVKLRGTVTMAAAGFLVMQDPTGGVFVYYASSTSAGQPEPGEVWEIEGVTDPGDFSPMVLAESATFVARAPLPAPARPSREQLAGGGLDAEMVEVEGVVDSVSRTEMVLLLRDGALRIIGGRFHPLPLEGVDPALLPGSVVRVRGVYTANWNATGQVNAGVCLLGNATMAVVSAAPADPFAAPRMKVAELLLFASQPNRQKRVVVSGTVLHARPPELFLTDDGRGFRAVLEAGARSDLMPGDRVEVAGLPRLGGPSPVLRQARVRSVGRSGLPVPVELSADRLAGEDLDSTRVKVVAQVLSDTRREQERVLELREGGHRFSARIADRPTTSSPLPRDSVVSLSGVYAAAASDRVGADLFELLVASTDELTLLRSGPWWTRRHTFALIGILAGGLVLALGWVLMLRRTVAQRSMQLAREIEDREASERHREMEAERSRVAQDLHDELGSGLTEAGILTSLVRSPAVPEEKKHGYLDQLSEVCRSLVTGLDEIVWAVNPRYDSVTDLAGYFSLFAQRFMEIAGIQCRLRIDGSVDGHPLDSHRRHGMFLAFKEALTNIARHSGASEVTLAISVDDGHLTLRLEDNGRGFDVSPVDPQPGSDGLHGMARRLQQLGGTCTVDSTPGQGTTIAFGLPLSPPPDPSP